ncbi:MAG: hypothetical protein ABH815_05665 [Candidatus Omnitrophota bacterium]
MKFFLLTISLFWLTIGITALLYPLKILKVKTNSIAKARLFSIVVTPYHLLPF